MTLADYKISEHETTDLLNVWFAIMSNSPPAEYLRATRQERADFYLAITAEINRRIPKPAP